MSVSSVQPAQAISSTSVHGAWQLLSYDVEEQANGNSFAPMGEKPSGYVIFTAEGRLSFMLSAEGRQPGSMRVSGVAKSGTLGRTSAWLSWDRLIPT